MKRRCYLGEEQHGWKKGAEGRTKVFAKSFWQDRTSPDFLWTGVSHFPHPGEEKVLRIKLQATTQLTGFSLFFESCLK